MTYKLDNQLILKEYNASKSCEKVSKLFGCSHSTINRIISKCGKIISNADRFYLYNDVKAIRKEYERTLDTKYVAKQFNTTPYTIRKCIVRSGGKIIANPLSHKFNEHYFDCIDREDKAYWLGFIMADGYVSKRRSRFEMVLARIDRDHLVKFERSIDRNKPISDGKRRNNNLHSRIVVDSVIFHRGLVRNGIIPNKTFKLKFPKLRSDLIRHFIRGYFDGDGSVSLVRKVSKNTNRIGVYIVGRKEFLNFMLNEFPFEKTVNVLPHGNVYTISIQSQPQVKELYDYFYKDSTIYLDRKYKKWSKFRKI